jgi:release factor glutamine methyltransferase
VTTIEKALATAVTRLQLSEQPRLEAEILLAHVLNKPRSHLYAWPGQELTDAQHSRFSGLVHRRARGEPVAHLTGHREFWSLELEVTADTLIPRPETELLVELVLELLPEMQQLCVADFGTGSGAVAIALAHERKHWHLVATDRSRQCLDVARRNAQRLKIPNIAFLRGDWSQALAGRSLDAIVSNPPYVADQDPHLRQGDVRFEPASALAAGPQGLDDLKKLIVDAARVLKAGAFILLEHSPAQTDDIHNLLICNGFKDITKARDLAGQDRVTWARNPV